TAKVFIWRLARAGFFQVVSTLVWAQAARRRTRASAKRGIRRGLSRDRAARKRCLAAQRAAAFRRSPRELAARARSAPPPGPGHAGPPDPRWPPTAPGAAPAPSGR